MSKTTTPPTIAETTFFRICRYNSPDAYGTNFLYNFLSTLFPKWFTNFACQISKWWKRHWKL